MTNEFKGIKGFFTQLEVVYNKLPDSSKLLFKQRLVLRLAKKHGLALGGSVGLAMATKNPQKLPKDLDFVTDSYATAIDFAGEICKSIWGGGMYAGGMKIYQQFSTDWVPSPAMSHIRINIPFLLPICIFVLRPNTLNVWYYKGYKIQDYKDITKAKEIVESRRGQIEFVDSGETDVSGQIEIVNKQIYDAETILAEIKESRNEQTYYSR